MSQQSCSRSYLSGRSFSHLWSAPRIKSWSLTVFNPYAPPIGEFIRQHNINLHCYADNTQLYIPLAGSDAREISHILACLSDTKCWMSQNLLQIKDSESDALLLVPSTWPAVLKTNTGNLSANIQHSTQNLAVLFNSVLRFDNPGFSFSTRLISESLSTPSYHLDLILATHCILNFTISVVHPKFRCKTANKH